MCIFYFPLALHHCIHAFTYAWKCFYLTITRVGMVPIDIIFSGQAIIPITHEQLEKQKTEMMKNGIRFQDEKEKTNEQ